MRHVLITQTGTREIEYIRTFVLAVPDDYDAKTIEGLDDNYDFDVAVERVFDDLSGDIENGWVEESDTGTYGDKIWVENDCIADDQLKHYRVVEWPPKEEKVQQ